ncbi:nucleotide pyrophosphohydrolase [Teredinibacter turnerae]|uniref:MazG nucleotide pyrophosphohydrolase n=1 Tax=Teredinibacter turnerae (strain ATCC 39867 / T7901) TaxID=377629 RepID=C5BNR2_TERTT|nr:nucleotide pyrophosphohydrolase [Teredinibacter turnerae]ACR11442.1 MazG nucleotide pyrophosphohydrolase [Teredinibacter turnerae T7901]
MSTKPRQFASIDELQTYLLSYAKERDWEQFHAPKNLVMALSVEVAELTEHFQWLSEEQSKTLGPDKLAEVTAEMADVFMYLARLAQVLDVDILAACAAKSEDNEQRYPPDKVRGSAKKYSEY